MILPGLENPFLYLASQHVIVENVIDVEDQRHLFRKVPDEHGEKVLLVT